MTSQGSDQVAKNRTGPDTKASTSSRPTPPAGGGAAVMVDDKSEGLSEQSKAFENPGLAEAISKLTLLRGEGSPASFLDIRTPSGKLDRFFTKAVDKALGDYVKNLSCKMDTPDELAEDIRKWVYKEKLADELNKVAQLASRRQSSEARQHILAKFHAALIHDLLRSAKDGQYRADPEDASGFLEAELFEMEKDDGALDRVAEALVDIVASENSRELDDDERLLAISEMRRAL